MFIGKVLWDMYFVKNYDDLTSKKKIKKDKKEKNLKNYHEGCHDHHGVSKA